MVQRRRRKRYGPVQNRGMTQWQLDKARRGTARIEAKERLEGTWYRIVAGTQCHVRKVGTKPWKPHTTKTSIECQGFLWRNQNHYGFEHSEFEVKVKVGKFTAIAVQKVEPESVWDQIEREAGLPVGGGDHDY
jgi:hypothetical protein